MKSIEFEVKIGLFVFVGLILLTIITFSLGDFFFKPGYHLNVVLGFANGVQKAAPVRLAGYDIGELKEAATFKDEDGKTKIRLKLWITTEAQIEKDAQVCINTLGLIGEKYVEIIPGTPGAEFLKDGDTIKGYDSISVEQMTKKSYDIALKLESVIESMDEIFNQIKSGEGTVGKLVYDDTIYTDAELLVKDIKAHPWKLIAKPAKVKEKTVDKASSRSGNNRGRF
ncbi:MlaD family protein [Candidatus Omnitrophota bacterium]